MREPHTFKPEKLALLETAVAQAADVSVDDVEAEKLPIRRGDHLCVDATSGKRLS